MLTARDIAALRAFPRAGTAPRLRPRNAVDCRNFPDPFGVGARDCAFWRDSAAAVAQARARWAAVWIDSAVAAFALQSRALFPRLFG